MQQQQTTGVRNEAVKQLGLHNERRPNNSHDQQSNAGEAMAESDTAAGAATNHSDRFTTHATDHSKKNTKQRPKSSYARLRGNDQSREKESFLKNAGNVQENDVRNKSVRPQTSVPLTRAPTAGRRRRTESEDDELLRLQREQEHYEELYELENGEIQKLDDEIAAKKQLIMEYRQRMGGSRAVRENEKNVTRNRKIMENRLQEARIRYMKVEEENARIKNKINETRHEKQMQLEILDRTRHDIQRNRNQISDIEYSNSELLANRMAIERQMTENREDADFRIESFQREWRQIQQQLALDPIAGNLTTNRKINLTQGGSVVSTLNGPGSSKICALNEILKGEFNRTNITEAKPLRGKNIKPEYEAKLKRDTRMHQWKYAMAKVLQENRDNRVESYTEALNTIKEKLDMEDTEEFVNAFKGIEADNYRAYSHMNELENELKTLRDLLHGKREMLSTLKTKTENEDNVKRRMIAEVKRTTTENTRKISEVKGEHIHTTHQLRIYLAGVKKLFTSALTSARIMGTLHNGAGTICAEDVNNIDIHNMMTYLGIIESTISQVRNCHVALVHRHVTDAIVSNSKTGDDTAAAAAVAPTEGGDTVTASSAQNIAKEEPNSSEGQNEARVALTNQATTSIQAPALHSHGVRDILEALGGNKTGPQVPPSQSLVKAPDPVSCDMTDLAKMFDDSGIELGEKTRPMSSSALRKVIQAHANLK